MTSVTVHKGPRASPSQRPTRPSSSRRVTFQPCFLPPPSSGAAAAPVLGGRTLGLGYPHVGVSEAGPAPNPPTAPKPPMLQPPPTQGTSEPGGKDTRQRMRAPPPPWVRRRPGAQPAAARVGQDPSPAGAGRGCRDPSRGGDAPAGSGYCGSSAPSAGTVEGAAGRGGAERLSSQGCSGPCRRPGKPGLRSCGGRSLVLFIINVCFVSLLFSLWKTAGVSGTGLWLVSGTS